MSTFSARREARPPHSAHPVFARRCVWALSLIVLACLAAPPARADAVYGKLFTMRQPDHTLIQVRIWGDEFYTLVESPEGYTLVRDPATKFVCYARLTPDGQSLVSTGVAVGSTSPDGLGLPKHLRVPAQVAANQARTQRAQFERRRWTGPGAPPQRRASQRSPRGSVEGICLIVDFSDDVGTIPPATVADFCNQEGFTGFGDNGSVRDYYYDISNGALTYTNYVPPAYFRAPHPKSYYTDPDIPEGERARELIIEALTHLHAQGVNLAQFDNEGDGVSDAVNCFYAGYIENAWAEGLWPHSWTVDFCADGVCTEKYQISDMADELLLGTFCHENGHMLMDWPDLYDYEYDSAGVGRFCIMCYGTTDTNPCEPCAYLKYISGWATPTLLTAAQDGLQLPVSSTNAMYMFAHPTLSAEYYLIENRQRTGRDAQLPDAGLALWHIDTRGDNTYQYYFPGHYKVTLVQADGRWDLEHFYNVGDASDLWKAPTYTHCTPTTSPNTSWWDGRGSGLFLEAVSASGPTMTFNFSPGADCNNDGTPDYQEIAACAASPACGDCDGNGVPDACDLAAGTALDCDGDSIPDSCELDVSYRVDDGSAENEVASWDIGHLIWLNTFTVQPGGRTIDAIDVAWAYAQTGAPTTLAIWRDPTNDGDPHDAELLWKTPSPVLVSNPHRNIFKRVSVPDVYVGAPGDVFFVGAYMQSSGWVAPLDVSVESGGAWLAEGSNLDHLADNDDTLFCLDGSYFAGVWLLRAHAATNDCNENLVPDSCEIAAGTSSDCNANSVADECETNLGVSISAQPMSQAVCAGESVTFSVSVQSSGTPAYQWRHDGVPIAGATNSSFTLAAPTLDDAGTYDVVVSSTCTSELYPAVTSATAVLTVDHAVIVTQPRDQHAIVGDTITFSVVANGPESLTYQWRKDGRALPGAVLTSCTVRAVTLADAGEYSVLVSGCGSTTSAAATLTVDLAMAAIPSPHNGADNVPVDVELRWGAVPEADRYEVYLGTDENMTLGGVTDTAAWNPHHLAYATKYFWKVIAYAGAASTEGLIWWFVTEPAPVPLPAVPANPYPPDGAARISPTVLLSWDAAPGAAVYKVLLGDSPALGASSRLVTSTELCQTAPSGLDAGTKYYWQVIAKNVGGQTAGPTWSFTTADSSSAGNAPVDSNQPAPSEPNTPIDNTPTDPNAAVDHNSEQPTPAQPGLLCSGTSAALLLAMWLGLRGSRRFR